MAPRDHGSSSTTVLEAPVELLTIHPKQETTSLSGKRAPSISGRTLSSIEEGSDTAVGNMDGNEPPPTAATTHHVQTWRSPRINLYRIPVSFWSFIIMGLNDATYGAIIPYLETYYSLDYAIVAVVFLSPFLGYNAAALLNSYVHLKLGQRGVAVLGPICHIIAYTIICLHPPYPALVIAFAIVGLGHGLLDAAWNAWIGAMADANEILGFLHAAYGLGGVLAPLIATSLITKAHLPWYYWYYFMLGFAVLEFCLSTHAFWSSTAAVFRAAHPRTSTAGGSRLKEAVSRLPAARVTWLSAFFLLGYVGTEVALGGWIVTFMIRVRHGAKFASGMTETGFWLGITIGRMILGFVTGRIGEKLAIAIYLPIAMGLQLLFWLVPQFYVSAVAVGLIGFFLGPLFPGAMVACTKLLPRDLHVSAIGFSAAFGGSGGAIFPYAVGAIAQARGVKVLEPIILALLAVQWLLWICLPRIEKKKD